MRDVRTTLFGAADLAQDVSRVRRDIGADGELTCRDVELNLAIDSYFARCLASVSTAARLESQAESARRLKCARRSATPGRENTAACSKPASQPSPAGLWIFQTQWLNAI